MNNFKSAGEKLNQGAKLLGAGKINAAIILFKSAIKIDPKLSAAHYDLALAYQRRGNPEDAIQEFETVLRLSPNDFDAGETLGNYLLNLGRSEKAVKVYKKILPIRPNSVTVIANLGAALARIGNFTEALEYYQKAIEIDPDYATSYVFLGNVLLAQGNTDDAIMCYKMAIEKDKKNADAYNNLGTAYGLQQKYGNAVSTLKKAIKIDKKNVLPLQNLAMAYATAHKTKQAIIHLKNVLKLQPEHSSALSHLIYQKGEAADWNGIEELTGRLGRLTAQEIALNIKPGKDPFASVVADENLKRNYDIARLWSQSLEEGITNKKAFKFGKINKKKLNIGYVSAHFHDHPTSQLVAGLFALHDRKKFTIFTYSVGPGDGSIYYKKIKEASDVFTDLYTVNFSDSAIRISKDKIDILIDLDGYTDNNRLKIFALRPSPVQVSYLGFPGTTGAKFIDYLIADTVVIPPKDKKFYSESVVYLPNSYQVNDGTQKINPKKYTRRNFGIQEASVAFASFNGTYKITPKVFDSWMKILKRVPNSILWLLKSNDMTEKNLKAEAKKRGINPERLIFSKRLPKDKHLARLSLADLSLDTFPCNGHTTTSDSLWAGVPVVALLGKHFASRVSASLLTAIGLPELITHSEKEYEDLAVSLAKNPKKLSTIRQSLITKRLREPLFDTERFTKDLETVYLKLWQNYLTKNANSKKNNK